MIRASLPEIFIPLYAHPPGKKEDRDAETDRIFGLRDHDRDIEDLVTEHPFLVIEGQAGSGKTTLIKHMAWMMVSEENRKGLEEHLPVLIFLKDLKDFEVGGGPPNAGTAERMLSHYICEIENETILPVYKGGQFVNLVNQR